MQFKNLFISVLTVGVVILCIFQFVIITQTDNNTEYLITNNTIIDDSYGGLYTNLDTAGNTANTSSDKFGDITPTQSYGIVDVTSVVSPTKLFRSLLVGTYNVLIELPVKILGVPPIIAGVIDAIIIFLVILGIWAIWRGVAT